jgi:hypothetical protein
MKGTRHLSRLGILLLLLGTAASAQALPPFSQYGPACQWIRLIGQIERPAGLDPDDAVFLTVTYQLPQHKIPHTLMTNQPLSADHFAFVLAGFDEEIADVHFVAPGFWFAREIIFNYYAATADRKWKSDWQRSVYQPVREKKDGQILCKTAIELQALKLEAQ